MAFRQFFFFLSKDDINLKIFTSTVVAFFLYMITVKFKVRIFKLDIKFPKNKIKP